MFFLLFMGLPFLCALWFFLGTFLQTSDNSETKYAQEKRYLESLKRVYPEKGHILLREVECKNLIKTIFKVVTKFLPVLHMYTLKWYTINFFLKFFFFSYFFFSFLLPYSPLNVIFTE